ncbi:MAG: hypothetical protein EOP47_01930 [Sphingobacteriaceae bacterium]|nr:MAG: hypothetical protein EOP47_01930 [Sphingobacteriaceae bacterium]
MKNSFLFPHKLRVVGWILFICGIILGAACLIWELEIPGFGFKMRETGSLIQSSFENFTNELALMLVVSGLLITAFSKEKVEDELIAKIRANSLYWAILVGFVVRFAFLVIQMSYYQLQQHTAFVETHGLIEKVIGIISYSIFFAPLLIFKLRFQYLLHQSNDVYALDRLYYLPKRPYRLIAVLLSVPLIFIYYYCMVNLFVPDYLTVLSIFASVPLIVWVYTKEDTEDEFITSLRLKSMQIAVCGYYCFLLLANIFLYSLAFMLALSPSIEIIAIIFLISFNWRLNRYNREQGGLAL